MLVSSLTGDGHDALWDHIQHLTETWKDSGWLKAQRTQQRLDALHSHARQLLIASHMHHKSEAWKRLEKEVLQGEASPFASARSWVHLPLNS